MITKKTFEEKRDEMNKILEGEMETMDKVQMNIMSIKAALQFIEQQIAAYPPEAEKAITKKKGLFKK